MKRFKNKILVAMICGLLMGGLSSCATWWAANIGPQGPNVSVGGTINNKYTPSKSSGIKKDKKNTHVEQPDGGGGRH